MACTDKIGHSSCRFAALLTACVLGACSTIAEVHPILYAADRGGDYPIAIVAATFVPPVEVDIALSGKADGAAEGIGQAALHCSPALYPGDIGAVLMFLPCLAMGSVVLAAVGAWSTAPKSEITPVYDLSSFGSEVGTQQTLAVQALAYLTRNDPALAAPAGVAGPASAADTPAYGSAGLDAFGSILELSVGDIRYTGSGRAGAPVCLWMTARGRRLDAKTGAQVDALTYTATVACLSPAEWLKDNGARVAGKLREGYRQLAENLIDELYLVYHPAPRSPGQAADPPRTVPDYVLAPISPAAPAVYVDFKPISRKRRHITGFGGMHFTDVDTLAPTLSWEAFPRPFDPPGDTQRIDSVTYELRIYEAGMILGKFAAPSSLVFDMAGLTDTHYRVESPLEPCSWYFWTVRAAFQLEDVHRVTEWAGAFHTAGGEFSPSWSRRNTTSPLSLWPATYLYYPFRTPAADGSVGCWE